MRWKTAISDYSSHSTGSTVFDFDGDGSVEVVYRDEQFLRVYRGADGVAARQDPDRLQHVDGGAGGGGRRQRRPRRHRRDLRLATGTASATPGVFVFQDVANKWARTRRIWNQHSYHITNVNEDGTIPLVETPNWLVPGLNNFRLNAFVPGERADSDDSFTYRASDGGLDSNVATVRIAVDTPNSPPRFTSSPVTTAAIGVRYTYAAQATDPDPGDMLTFSLPTAPAGMTIDPSAGLIQWTPTASQLGSHPSWSRSRTSRGLFALQGYAVRSPAR